MTTMKTTKQEILKGIEIINGSKNWQFCGSPEEATASACIYSLVETAKVNGLNHYKYLEFLLSRFTGCNQAY